MLTETKNNFSWRKYSPTKRFRDVFVARLFFVCKLAEEQSQKFTLFSIAESWNRSTRLICIKLGYKICSNVVLLRKAII